MNITLSMPQLIYPRDDQFVLGNTEINKKQLEIFRKLPRTNIITHNDIPVYLTRFKGKDTLYAEFQDQIVYFMTMGIKTYDLVNRSCVTQLLVWKQKTVPFELDDLPMNIFFDFLVKRYKNVLSDSQQTEGGSRFWINRIKESIQKGINVYYCDFVKKTIEKVDRNNLQNFISLAWSTAKIDRSKRFLITTDAIQTRAN